MTKNRHLRISLLTALLFVLLISFNASAAIKINRVSEVKISSYKTTAYLSWKKLKYPNGYELATVDAKGKIIDTQIVSSNSVILKNLKPGKTYRYKIRGFKTQTKKVKVDGVLETRETTLYGDYSQVVVCKPATSALEAPTSLAEDRKGDKSVTLTWGRVSKGAGYSIEVLDEATGEFVQLATTKGAATTTATLSNLKANTTYTFRVRAYKKSGSQYILGAPSKKLSVKIIAFSGDLKKIRNARYVGTIKKTVKATTSKGTTIKLKAGTVVYTTVRVATSTVAYLKDGTKIKSILTSNIKYTGLDSNPKNDYSKTAKEQFINLRGYSSNTPYLIWISQHKLRVNVFQGSKGNWKLVQSFPCCVGMFDARTPSGMHKILKSIPYGDYGGPYIWFATGFDKGGTPENPQGCAFHNQIGTAMSQACSHGCIRLYTKDLNWLYQNCKVGTTVYAY